MKKVYFTIGLPSSGKNTWVESQLDKREGKRIASDEIRSRYSMETNEGSDPTHSYEETIAVFDIFKSKFVKEMKKGTEEIFLDSTGLQRKRRLWYYEEAKKNGYKFIAVHFNLPPDVCIERNDKRKRVVPKDIIIKMDKKREVPEVGVDCDSIIEVVS